MENRRKVHREEHKDYFMPRGKEKKKSTGVKKREGGLQKKVQDLKINGGKKTWKM